MNKGALLYRKEWVTAVGVIHTTETAVSAGRYLQLMCVSGCTSQLFVLILKFWM